MPTVKAATAMDRADDVPCAGAKPESPTSRGHSAWERPCCCEMQVQASELSHASGVELYAAVVAHPDDDAYGMAGTVALHAADPDFRFILIHATDGGGGGDIREGFPATRESSVASADWKTRTGGERWAGRPIATNGSTSRTDSSIRSHSTNSSTPSASSWTRNNRPSWRRSVLTGSSGTPITSRSALPPTLRS